MWEARSAGPSIDWKIGDTFEGHGRTLFELLDMVGEGDLGPVDGFSGVFVVRPLKLAEPE